MMQRIITTAALALLAAWTIGCGQATEEPAAPGADQIPAELREEIRNIVREEVQAHLMEYPTEPRAWDERSQKPEPAEPEPAEPETAEPEPGQEPDPTERPQDPRAGICPRTPELRQALLLKLNQDRCGQVTPEHLYSITNLQVTTQKVRPQDFQDLFNLEELLLDGLTQPLEPSTFSSLHNLRKLEIYTIRNAQEGGNLLQPGTFSGLGSLRSLRVGSDDGWTAFQLDRLIMQGMPELEQLDINYISSVSQSALQDTRNLQDVRLHIKRNRGESYDRMPRSIFAHLIQLRKVHIQNLRWPPVLDVAGRDAACSAREWTSSAGGNGHTTPLSVRIENGPTADLESLDGCP